jgi:hypothetical protein
LLFVPTDFHYWIFGALLLINNIGGGLFSAPNSTEIMNSGMFLSMGISFSLMVVGLANSLPSAMFHQLVHFFLYSLAIAMSLIVGGAVPEILARDQSAT